jgi:SAM-dependent methyltransferase
MRVLAAIPSYGMKNQVYLERLLDAYRTMTHEVDIVVLSDIPRDLGPKVEVVIGRPAKDPRSLPFAHKQILADRLDDYDLFIYSEDDTFIEQRHIDAFLEVTAVLPSNQIAGFLRYEEDAAGRRYCSTIHSVFHWLPDSVQSIGPHVFARFTNDHAAAYVLTQDQLRRAIASGGFLVAPHQGRYDLLCSAATDPYTQCGFHKVICISRLDDFLLHHLSNRYVGRMGLAFDELRAQTNALLRCARDGEMRRTLFPTVTKLHRTDWDRRYYETRRDDVLAEIPADARQALSVGCGAGETEVALVEKGVRVVGIPLDTIIAESARIRGIELMPPDFRVALDRLSGERFDCIFLLHVLQYIREPQWLLKTCAGRLTDRGRILLLVPNFGFLRHRLDGTVDARLWRAGEPFGKVSIHRTTSRLVGKWAADSGLRITKIRYDEQSRFRPLIRACNGLAGRFLSRHILMAAEKA